MKAVAATLSSWHDLVALAEASRGFFYRGQADASWPLQTSLERAYRRHLPFPAMPEIGERWALHEFKAKAHLFLKQCPAPDASFEWLALLQHHGCPTRLLDFTLSPYIATYYAVASAAGDACVFAVNVYSLRDSLQATYALPYRFGYALRDEINALHIALFNECLKSPDSAAIPHLIPLESTMPSARVVRQQAVFLAPTVLSAAPSLSSFATCLDASLGTSCNEPETISVADLLRTVSAFSHDVGFIRLTLPQALRAAAMKQLGLMGLSEETLFPDLDGLARSLVQKHLHP